MSACEGVRPGAQSAPPSAGDAGGVCEEAGQFFDWRQEGRVTELRVARRWR
jgi:hypothetical protein